VIPKKMQKRQGPNHWDPDWDPMQWQVWSAVYGLMACLSKKQWHLQAMKPEMLIGNSTYSWANYYISLTWIKAILGWCPLLTMIPVRSQWGRYNLPRYRTSMKPPGPVNQNASQSLRSANASPRRDFDRPRFSDLVACIVSSSRQCCYPLVN